jgi:hypothetical protein
VELVAVKWHNLPSLPNFLRAGNGLAFGTVPHLLEPLWSYLPEFIGDDFYRCRCAESVLLSNMRERRALTSTRNS